MRSVLLAVLVIAGFSSFAETHGGVLRANAAFQTISGYAMSEAGSLSRVLAIKKLHRVPCEDGIFKITWGGMDANGDENPDKKPTYVLAKMKGYGKDGQPEFELKTVDGPHCPK